MAATDQVRVESKIFPAATVVIVDIVGFCTISSGMTNAALAQLRALVNVPELVRSTLLQHGGDVVQLAGDATVCIFDSTQTDSAIQAAMVITSRLKSQPASPQAKIGIATGQVIVTSV